MHHLNPEWQTPPDGDFARYVEQLNANAALHEAIARRRQAERQQRASQGATLRPVQQQRAAAPRLPQQTAPQRAPQRTTARPTSRPQPAASPAAQTSALVGKIILGVIVAFVALLLLADTEDGMDIFGFFIVAFIAWRVFFGGKRKA